MSDGPSVALREAKSFAYIVFWLYKFWFRQAILGRLLPWVLGVLFVIEVVGPLTHFLEFPGPVRYVLAILLLLTAIVLVFHHHRLRHRISRYNVLLGSMMVLFEEESRRYTGYGHSGADEQTVKDALQVLTFALEHSDPMHVVNASVVLRPTPSESFTLLAQDPRSAFQEDVSLHPITSAAGCASMEALGSLVYVPRTDLMHGVRIAPESDVAEGNVFRTARIVANAFEPLATDPAVLKSLLCVRISIDRSDSASVVRCLSRDRRDGMGELEFQAIKLAAALISIALSRNPSIIATKKRVNHRGPWGYD